MKGRRVRAGAGARAADTACRAEAFEGDAATAGGDGGDRPAKFCGRDNFAAVEAEKLGGTSKEPCLSAVSPLSHNTGGEGPENFSSHPPTPIVARTWQLG